MAARKKEPVKPIICKDIDVMKAIIAEKLRDDTDFLKDTVEALQCPDGLKQVTYFKKMGKYINNSSVTQDVRELVSKILVDLFFTATCESPGKRAVFVILELNDSLNNTSQIMSVRLKEELLSPPPNINTTAKLIDDILMCQDISFGRRVIQECLDEVLDYLKKSLEQMMHLLQKESEPKVTTDIFSLITKILKSVSFILQPTCTASKLKFPENWIEQMFSHVSELLTKDTSLLNCRISSGMLVPTFLKLMNGPNYFLDLMRSPFDKSIVHHLGFPDIIPLAEICLLSGLLRSLSKEELLLTDVSGKCLLVNYTLCNILEISNRSKEPSLVLTCSKTVCQCTKKVLELLEDEESTLLLLLRKNKTYLDLIMQYVYSHWEHYMDAVIQQVREIFQNVVSISLYIHTGQAQEDYLKTLAQTLLELPWHRKGKYHCFSHLTEVFGCQKMILLRPSVIKEIMSALEERSMGCYVKDLVKKMSSKHKGECSTEEWETTWLTPLIQNITEGNKLLPALQENILPVLIEVHPETINFIYKESSAFEGQLLPSIMKCLLSDRKQVDGENIHKWKNLLNVAICHKTDQVRLDALRLLCEHQKSCEPVLPTALELVQLFIKLNLKSQSPAFRQQVSACLKKVLHRIYDSSCYLRKNKKENDSQDVLKKQSEFLTWMWNYLFSFLYPGANFACRSTVFALIHLINSININKGSSASINLEWSTEKATSLVYWLKDTYEYNKEIILEVLETVPAELFKLDEDNRIEAFFTAAIQLTRSARPPDCVTGAYLLCLLVRLPETYDTAVNCLNNYHTGSITLPAFLSSDKNNRFHSLNGTILVTVTVLLCELQNQLSIAEENLLEASSTGPMYGVLLIMKYLMARVLWTQLNVEDRYKYKALLETMITVSMKVAAVVEPIVSNISPEGYLPVNNDPETVELLQVAVQKGIGRRVGFAALKEDGCLDSSSSPGALDAVKTKAVTSQMLLLCSWRAHKGVSLLFGDLCEILESVECADEKQELLTHDQIVEIGNFFMNQLSTVKHRGAFEQAYTAFLKLCHVLWRSKDHYFQTLPFKWLQELITVIQETGITATRRSAGLPYIFQALLVSEPIVRGSASFHWAMKHLLEMATEDPESNIGSVVHAMNILRALYRETKLGDYVMPYVSDGIQVAILGYEAKSWAIRNSATLLFSTLMTRIFGVNRSRSEPHKKNCLTGQVFFMRFPALFDSILNQLKSVEKEDKERYGFQSSLFPVLLLLSRLYPSPVEGQNSNLKLAAFVPYLQKCSYSPIWKIRSLAAKALISFIPFDQQSERLNEVFKALPFPHDYKEGMNNLIHGLLLQVYFIIEDLGNSDEAFKNCLCSHIKTTLWIITEKNPCLVTRTAYVTVLEKFLEKFSDIDTGLLENIITLTDQEIDLGFNLPRHLPEREFYLSGLVRLYLQLKLRHPQTVPSCGKSLTEFLLQMLSSKIYECRWTCIRFVYLWITQQLNGSIHLLSDDDEDLDKEEYDKSILHSLIASEDFSKIYQKLIDIIMQLSENPLCLYEAYRVLSISSESLLKKWDEIKSLPEKLDFLLKRLKSSQNDTLTGAILEFSTSVAKSLLEELQHDYDGHKNSSLIVLRKWLEVLAETSEPDANYHLRLTASKILSRITEAIVKQEFWGISLPYWKALVNLLQDDEPKIRENSVSTVDLLMKIQGECEPYYGSRYSGPLEAAICSFVHYSSPMLAASTLIVWMLSCDMALLDVETDEQPFDKGELNTYAEEIPLTDVCSKHLASLINLEQSIVFSKNLLVGVKAFEGGSEYMSMNETVELSLAESAKQLKLVKNECDIALNRHIDVPLIQLYQHIKVGHTLWPFTEQCSRTTFQEGANHVKSWKYCSGFLGCIKRMVEEMYS